MMAVEQAETIAIDGLQHIAADPEQLGRFLALTGLGPDDLRQQAGTRAFYVAILDFYMGNEPTLIAFAAETGRNPAEIARAHATLSGPDHTLGSGEM